MRYNSTMNRHRFLLPAGMVLLLFLAGCQTTNDYGDIDFRQEMRDFVIAVADEARAGDPDFLIIPQNGQELATLSGAAGGTVAASYMAVLSATGREDLFFGYTSDDAPTPEEDRLPLEGLCDLFLSEGKTVLVTDYCSTPSRMDESYSSNSLKGYLSFAADERDLNSIPSYPASPVNLNSSDIEQIGQTRNFLYLINPESYATKNAFLQALGGTDYDLLIIDLFWEDEMLTPTDLAGLHRKKNGGHRLVVSYMSIGEAESYRYYWQPEWDRNRPDWLERENPFWPGNYKVQYWNREWQNLICGGADSYLKRIQDAGFDGVYLDIIDGYEYFE